MKIVLLVGVASELDSTPSNYMFLSLGNELSRRGHETIRLGYHILRIPGLERNSLYHRAVVQERETFGKYTRPIAKNFLTSRLRRLKPDLLVTFFPVRGLAQTLREIGCKLVFWSVDEPECHSPSLFEFARQCDLVYSNSKGTLPTYREEGVDRVKYLADFVDPQYFFPIATAQDKFFTFVGGCWPSRERSQETIAYPLIEKYGKNVSITGPAWERNRLGQRATLSRRVSWRKLALLYGQTRIALAMHTTPRAEAYQSIDCRVFEILACKAFLLADHPKGIEEFLQAGKHLVVSDSAAQTLELADYYLDRPDERESIARAGREIVLANHTVRNRVDEIEPVLRKL